MKNIEENGALEEKEFIENQLHVEGAWRYLVGGVSVVGGAALTYFTDFTAGYIILSAGLATYMNGRDFMKYSEDLNSNLKNPLSGEQANRSAFQQNWEEVGFGPANQKVARDFNDVNLG